MNATPPSIDEAKAALAAVVAIALADVPGNSDRSDRARRISSAVASYCAAIVRHEREMANARVAAAVDTERRAAAERKRIEDAARAFVDSTNPLASFFSDRGYRSNR